MPARVKAPHHKGTYHVRSARLRAAAYADPTTTCWRCGLTLDQIRQLKPRARWTAGHLNPGEINGTLLPECSPCNYSHGAALGNRQRALNKPKPIYHHPRTNLTW